ncbi:hypothetical protein AX17_005930 [Amanita inopinata Kibby_2008]|nr:hypothetical protein AX17_005930 [Amanita inopinata Kibby_2008]
MTSYKRIVTHRLLKSGQVKRQGGGHDPGFVPGFKPTTDPNPANTATDTQPASNSQPQTTPLVPLPPTTSSSTSQPTTKPQNTTTQKAVTTSAATSPSSPVTTSIPTTTNVVTSATSAVVPTMSSLVHTTPSVTYSHTDPTLTGTTPSATPSQTSSGGGVSVGAVVGGVAGGLLGIVILIALISYIARWWNRRQANEFNDEYNSPDVDFSPTAGNTGSREDDVFGPQMTQHGSSPSIGGGAGMAGQGILATRATIQTNGPGSGPNIPYGAYARDDESYSGAYSSQPLPQAPYNPEAYGAYAPYESGQDYQEAMRDYQGQRAYENHPYGNGNYVTSNSPVPQAAVPLPISTPSPGSILPPAASPPPAPPSAGAPAARSVPAALTPGGSEPRRSGAYTQEDAYGGF